MVCGRSLRRACRPGCASKSASQQKPRGHLVGPELKREHKQRPEVVERVFRDLIFEHRCLGRGKASANLVLKIYRGAPEYDHLMPFTTPLVGRPRILIGQGIGLAQGGSEGNGPFETFTSATVNTRRQDADG